MQVDDPRSSSSSAMESDGTGEGDKVWVHVGVLAYRLEVFELRLFSKLLRLSVYVVCSAYKDNCGLGPWSQEFCDF
jgi:hypothetical protein